MEGLRVVHDCSQNLVEIEGCTGLLEYSKFSVGARPRELLGRQWHVHREPSDSATDHYRQIASWTD